MRPPLTSENVNNPKNHIPMRHPDFMTNRLQECFGLVLRERFRAKVAADVEAEVRAWKLFRLIPMMYCTHLTEASVPWAGMSWCRESISCAVPWSSQQASTEEEEQAHRGKAALTSQKGHVSQATSRVDRGISGATQCSHVGGISS